MPYKFSAEVATTPFSSAPDVIMKALHRMIWAGNKASEDEPLMKLNEVLVLGYFKDQKIGVSKIRLLLLNMCNADIL